MVRDWYVGHWLIIGIGVIIGLGAVLIAASFGVARRDREIRAVGVSLSECYDDKREIMMEMRACSDSLFHVKEVTKGLRDRIVHSGIITVGEGVALEYDSLTGGMNMRCEE